MHVHEIENQDTFFSVRGKVKANDTAKPITPNTIEQAPWSVKVFIITVKVKR